MRISDNFDIHGRLKVEKVYKDGTREVVFEEDNLVVLEGRQHVLAAIYQDPFTPNPIKVLQFGTGGSLDPEGQFPRPISKNMTSLFNSIGGVDISYTVDNSFPKVTFLADVEESMANYLLISEAGLFMKNGAMFNIKTFPGIPKTSEFSIHFEWTIDVT